MSANIRTGMFVEYTGPTREGLKFGDQKLVNDADEFGIRLVGVLGYFDPSDFEIPVPRFEKLSEEEKGVLLQAMVSGQVVQVRQDTGFWKDIVFKNLIVFNKKAVYRIKSEKIAELDVLYRKQKTARQMLLDAERDISLKKKEIRKG